MYKGVLRYASAISMDIVTVHITTLRYRQWPSIARTLIFGCEIVVAGAGRKNSPFSGLGVVLSNEFERDERVLDRELLMDRVVLVRRECARSMVAGVRVRGLGVGIWGITKTFGDGTWA